MTDPTRVTERQNTYLQFLQDGPRTTRDFALEFMVSAVNVGKILDKLRNAGLVQSSKAPGTPGNIHHYALTAPYHTQGDESIMITTCPDCRNENKFCNIHQKHEKEVYESTRFRGKHDTQEFRMALMDARNRDIEED